MKPIVSPIFDPATGWTFKIVSGIEIPAGLRYAGYTFRGLRAERGNPSSIRMPADGTLRRKDTSSKSFVEVQVNPFPIRRLAARFPGGLPTFYLAFDSVGTPLSMITSFVDDDYATVGELLGQANAVTIGLIGQDRVTLDPLLWVEQLAGLVVPDQANINSWDAFSSAVAAALSTKAILLLSESGQPLDGGSVKITFTAPGGAAASTAQVALVPADGGDLQQAVARLNAANPGQMPIASLWDSTTQIKLQPVPVDGSATPATRMQIARLEDGATSATGEIGVDQNNRHILFTDLHTWYTTQFALAAGANQPALERFTRGNIVKPLVNGPEYFRDLFIALHSIKDAGNLGGYHLAGWDMNASVDLVRPLASDPSDLPLNLDAAAKLIVGAGGNCRFLPSRFYQVQAPLAPEIAVEAAVFTAAIGSLWLLDHFDAFRTDIFGFIVLGLGLIGASVLLDAGGLPKEPSAEAVKTLNFTKSGSPIAQSVCNLASYPAIVDDNTAKPPMGGFPFNTLFKIMRHFGIYHQKLSILRTGSTSFIGYCGGIDCNPDRLDDAQHLKPGKPFHDVHARIEGPAVHDLAVTMDERWMRDGKDPNGTPIPPAFPPPAASTLVTPGPDATKFAVQVARTYFRAANATRALEFAQWGDGTLVKTLLNAIEAAQEFIYIEDQYLTPPKKYRDALVGKISRGEIRTLVLVAPGLADQPFGELIRSGFVADLRAADNNRGIVRVGYPRRRYTVPDNDLRASSGKCILGEDLSGAAGMTATVVLGPAARVPTPPFWVAVDGELMWVYDESTDPAPAGTKRLKVHRGGDTRLVRGGAAPEGPTVREHKSDAPATVVDLASIYVHAKMMIVDDVFLSIGSANLNRRGMFHDGEVNIFAIPQTLKIAPNNPIAALRRKLWAEMLDLPPGAAEPVLQDPLAAAELFDRSPFAGNRFTDIDAYPAHIMLGATTGDGLLMTLVNLIALNTGVALGVIEPIKLFDGVVDPSSLVETMV